MDSLDRIFKSINESSHMGKKKAKKTGKKNRYDSSSFGMKAESKMPTKSKPTDMTTYPMGSAGPRTRTPVSKKEWEEKRQFPRGRSMPGVLRKKIGEDVIQILGIIKEAYEDELISEEAFLAIADPIMRSLMEVTFPDTYEKEDLDDAEKEEKPKPKPKPKKTPMPTKDDYIAKHGEREGRAMYKRDGGKSGK